MTPSGTGWWLLALAACGTKATPTGIDVRVNPTVEAMAIAERLVKQPEYVEAKDCAYVRDVDQTFAAYATDATPVARYHFEKAPRAALADHAIDAFAQKAQVDAFLAKHAEYVGAVESKFRDAIPTGKLLEFLHREHGDVPALHITPSLLQGPQNYGLRVDNQLYQLMGLGEVDDQGMPKKIDVDLIVHEINHGFVNDQIDARAAEIDPPAATIFALVQPKMDAQHYSTPRIMIYESVVRAIVVAWVRETRGDDAAAAEIRDQVRLGFLWTADLEGVVGKHFDPAAVTTFFTQLAKKYATGLPRTPYQGPIDGVFGDPPFTITYAPALESYARSVASQIFHDRAHFGEEPHVGMVAYGSPATNPIVTRVQQRSRFQLDASGLLFGSKRWPGRIVMIMTWPREDDPSKGIVVYTAANDADLDGVNTIHAGSTDYVIAEKTDTGFRVIESGNFPRARDGAWEQPR
ncbi:MAG: DUF4932 domain-containing protein [Kofleriaceae bacterium]